MALHIAAIVQARMSSRRLPGKVLRVLEGKPVLAWLIERLRTARGVDDVVVATSTDPSDDPIERWTEGAGVRCYRGALDNVAERFCGAMRWAGVEVAVRVSADSPLLSPRIVERGVDLFRVAPVDVVTNVAPRSYPKGQSVEVVRAAALERVLRETSALDVLEHVTMHMYRNAHAYTLLNFEAPADASGLGFAIDTPQDFARIESWVRAAGRCVPLDYEGLLAMARGSASEVA